MARKPLTQIQRRCEDCANLKIVKGCWLCDECFGQPIEEVDDCPEGMTIEKMQEIKAMDSIKISTGAKAEEKKARKPRERKPDEEKENLIAKMADFLEKIVENVNITNKSKVIEFDIGENHYKIDLIRQRQKKS